MNNRPSLGQWCEFRAIAVKSHENKETSWVRSELEHPGSGMYIGFRTVFNGAIEMATYQESWEHPVHELGEHFIPHEAVQVWLFVVGERKNFVRVFPQDVIQRKAEPWVLHEELERANAE
jgi:hypothetical protein